MAASLTIGMSPLISSIWSTGRDLMRRKGTGSATLARDPDPLRDGSGTCRLPVLPCSRARRRRAPSRNMWSATSPAAGRRAWNDLDAGSRPHRRVPASALQATDIHGCSRSRYRRTGRAHRPIRVIRFPRPVITLPREKGEDHALGGCPDQQQTGLYNLAFGKWPSVLGNPKITAAGRAQRAPALIHCSYYMCASRNTPAVTANETAKYAANRAANQPADCTRDSRPTRGSEGASASSSSPDCSIIDSLPIGAIPAPARSL